MAASVIASPLAMNPVYNPIIYKINLSDIGTDEARKYIYYKVIFTDADGNVFDVYTSDPLRPFSAGQNFDIDVSKDIQGYLSTSLPANFGNVIPMAVADKRIWGKVKLEVYEVTRTLEDCSSTETLGDTGDEVFVFNGAVQDYQQTYLNFPSTVQFLDLRPNAYEIDRNAIDYIWVWGTTNVTYTPNVGSPVTISAANQVNIISMRPFGVYGPTMKYMDVTFSAIEGGKTLRVGFKDECYPSSVSRNISYLHPFGGRSVISLDQVEDLGVTFDQEVIYRYKAPLPTGTNADTLTNANHAGNTIFNKRTTETVTLVHSTNVDQVEEIEQMKAFLSSSGYLIQTKNVGSSSAQIWRKFIIDSGSIVYSKQNESVDLIVSGRMSTNYVNQTNDR